LLKKENAVQAWRKLIGPFSSVQAKETAPSSIRANFGTDSRINAVFGADSVDIVNEMKELLFDPKLTTLEPDSEDKSFGVQKSLVIIKSDILANGKLDEVLDRIICKGFHVTKREEVSLSREQVRELYPNLADEESIEFLSSAPVLALLVTGECAITGLLEMIGPIDPLVCKETCPMSIRALFGTDLAHNAIQASESHDAATHEITNLFPTVLRTGNLSSKTDLTNVPHLERTLALIKPDAYGSGKKEEILDLIVKDRFTIIKQSEIRMTLGQAREFYKEHDGKPFYETLTTWMCRYVRLTQCSYLCDGA
jgi:nucleoside diphosphate kinase